ncbi:4.1 protein [Ostertagia ostertagi]
MRTTTSHTLDEEFSDLMLQDRPPKNFGNVDMALGEFVSCKTLTSGNRTVETYTYKTERDGIIETHVEHRVTIHSDEPIDHDAELSQAIMEATQMNPDMTVRKDRSSSRVDGIGQR